MAPDVEALRSAVESAQEAVTTQVSTRPILSFLLSGLECLAENSPGSGCRLSLLRPGLDLNLGESS